jgi:hypothetical protein
MMMKKTSGGDSPLRQGAGKSFWTLPIFGSMAVADRDVFWKSDRVLRFFPSRDLYRRRASSGVGRGAITHRGRGQGPGRAALLCGAFVAPLRLLFGSLEASVNFWTFSFCFVQIREYFLCNFSETQKQQKIGNWHCGDLLIGQFWKMHKCATKCNETLSKWCKNKHGASKIIDTFETYQCFIKLGLLNALVADEEVYESIPSFLGGGDVADERIILLGKRHVDEMQGGGIELLVDLLPR